ncbi:MAG: hypothetical protein ABJA02_15265 [Acidobacteriota bacterium]
MQIKMPALAVAIVLFVLCVSGFGQTASPQMLKQTTTKTDKFDFGVGGTVAIIGAPNGSIRVVGSSRNEIEISAEIEIEAATEADLARIAQVTTFITDESTGRVTFTTSGTHNKLGSKKLWKKFPKNLIGLPFRIDYTVSVPRYCDLQIDGGKGDLSISGVEGAIRVNSIDSNAKLELIGGGLNGTFGSGTVDITMPDRSWRGSSIDVSLAKGTMAVHLPINLSAELDATILKAGKIENAFTTFKPRTRTVPFTDMSVIAKAGSGGVSMKFTVGDGTLSLRPIGKPSP